MDDSKELFYASRPENASIPFGTDKKAAVFRVVNLKETDASFRVAETIYKDPVRVVPDDSWKGSGTADETSLPYNDRLKPHSIKAGGNSYGTSVRGNGHYVGNLSGYMLSAAADSTAKPFRESDSFGLEAAGKTIETIQKAAAVVKRTTGVLYRRASGRVFARTRKTGASVEAFPLEMSADSSSGAVIAIALAAVFAVGIAITTAFVLIILISVISAFGLVASVSTGFYWPLESHRYIASGYGAREVFYAGGVQTSPFHTGIDLPAPEGTAIGAASYGTVTSVVISDAGYGNYVLIRHENGYETRYAHMKDIFVAEGQEVYPTEIIGTVGSTGTSTGNHLHFELRLNGTHIDPLTIEYLEWNEFCSPPDI